MAVCTGCGREMEADQAFCGHCGVRRAAGGPRRLVRIPSHGRLAGVCAGLAEYLDVDVTLVRLLWILLGIVPGGIVGGLAGYVAAALVMPAADRPGAQLSQLMRSRTDRKLGGVCGGLAAYLGLDATAVRVAWIVVTVVPGAIVLGLAAYLIAWVVMPLAPLPALGAAPQPA